MLMGLSYGREVDWWALGIILYEFVYGAPPFNDDSPQKIFENILDQQVCLALRGCAGTEFTAMKIRMYHRPCNP
jgi:serine/threonine protein kinase